MATLHLPNLGFEALWWRLGGRTREHWKPVAVPMARNLKLALRRLWLIEVFVIFVLGAFRAIDNGVGVNVAVAAISAPSASVHAPAPGHAPLQPAKSARITRHCVDPRRRRAARRPRVERHLLPEAIDPPRTGSQRARDALIETPA